MRIPSIFVVSVMAAGCDLPTSAVTRTDENIVVLSKTPIALAAAPIVFSGSEPMKVLGRSSSLCLVIRDNISIAAQTELDAAMSDAIRGSSLKIEVETTEGLRKVFNEPMVGWRKSGVVLAAGELSACSSAVCDAHLPTGAIVKTIEVSANPALTVKGAYWWSRSDLPETKRSDAPRSTSQNRDSNAC